MNDTIVTSINCQVKRIALFLAISGCAQAIPVDGTETVDPGLVLSPDFESEDEIIFVAEIWSSALRKYLGPDFVAIGDGGVTVRQVPREEVWLPFEGMPEIQRWVNAYEGPNGIFMRDDIESFECRSRVLAHEVGHRLGAVHQEHGLMAERGPVAPAEACGWEIDDLALKSVLNVFSLEYNAADEDIL